MLFGTAITKKQVTKTCEGMILDELSDRHGLDQNRLCKIIKELIKTLFLKGSCA